MQTQIQTQIDNLIQSLQGVKVSAETGSGEAQTDFENILNATLAELNASAPEISEANAQPTVPQSIQATADGAIPPWFDIDYGYDPSNPCKPNMRELMEALSDRSVEDFYSHPYSYWQNISKQASEMLYGVVGSNEDTRDWQKIMSALDIVKAARQAIGEMYDPVVDIVSEYTDGGELSAQVAVLKDKNGTVLRALPENINGAQETLNNFGATSSSIPNDLVAKSNPEFLNKNFIDFLGNFRNIYEKQDIAGIEPIETAEALASLNLKQ